MEGILSIANTSISSLYGCVGCSIKEYILSRFPKGFFNYTSVSSELASRNMRRTLGSNTNNEFAKRIKPYLIIQPTYIAADLDGVLQNIPLTKNMDDLQFGIDKRYLNDVIKDNKYNYSMKYKLNRDAIDFDISVVVSTLHQQLDIYKTIQNQIRWDNTFYLRTALEAVIPKSMIENISACCNMSVKEHEENIPIFLKYINGVSVYPITYKMRNASATDEWFIYYTHNLAITFYDLSIESGQKKNMVEDSYQLTFKVSVSFNVPGVYMLCGEKNTFTDLDITLVSGDDKYYDADYIPLFSLTNLFNKYPPEIDGMLLYCSSIFTTNKDNKLEDRVSISEILDKDHTKAIRAHSSLGMDMSTLLKVIIIKDSEELIAGDTTYRIDYNTLEAVIIKPDPISTYRIVLYFNYSVVNEYLNNTAYDKFYDIDKPHDNNEASSEMTSMVIEDFTEVIETIDSGESNTIIEEQTTAETETVTEEIPTTFTSSVEGIQRPTIVDEYNEVVTKKFTSHV